MQQIGTRDGLPYNRPKTAATTAAPSTDTKVAPTRDAAPWYTGALDGVGRLLLARSGVSVEESSGTDVPLVGKLPSAAGVEAEIKLDGVAVT